VQFFDAETGETHILPARFGMQPFGQGGEPFVGVDGGIAGGVVGAESSDPGMGTMVDTTESLYPARVNCKVAMRFATNVGGSSWFVCSGTMIDAETVLLAAHCVYWRFDPSRPSILVGRAEEVYVFPGWDGNGDATSNAGGIYNSYGYARGTQYLVGSNYINSGDLDADLANVRLTRAVGFLTGWHGYAWGQSCNTIQNRTYFNYSFPAEGCGTAGLHTGADMKYWDGDIDSCPDNQMQIDTTPGCFTAVWGGMSGSSMYYISDGNRYAHAVCSTSNRSTRGKWAINWEAYKNDMVDFITDTRGSAFDLQALDCNFSPTNIAAGDLITSGSFLAVNPTNNNPANRTYTFRVYRSTNSDISTSDTLLHTGTFTWDFAAMSSVRVNMGDFTIPGSTTPGNYFLGVILDPATDDNDTNSDTDEWDAVAITVTAPIPDNNACSPGFSLPLNSTIAGTTAAATNDGDTTCGGASATTGRDVWYRFVAPYTARYNIETLSPGTLTDTVLSVHSACPGTVANTIVCNDNSGVGNLSLVTFEGVAGTTYRVRVTGIGSTTGTFSIRASIAVPLNNNCASAIVASLGNTTGTNRGATNDGDTNCGGSSATTGLDVWYRFTAPCSGSYTFDTEGSPNLADTVLSIHSACPGTVANTLACNDDGGTNFLSRIAIDLTSGRTYYVRVTGYGGTTGEFDLNIAHRELNNDSCGRATIIESGQTLDFSTCAALPTLILGGEPTCRAFTDTDSLGADVYFRWTPACNGRVTISTCRSNYDTRMAVYTECPTSTSRIVSCNDDSCRTASSVSFNATGSTRYVIRIGGTGGARGSGQVNVAFDPSCPADLDDGSGTGVQDCAVTLDDLLYYLGLFEAGVIAADLDNGSGTGVRDGGVGIEDLLYFLTRFEGGC
jgi:hypothetical protein